MSTELKELLAERGRTALTYQTKSARHHSAKRPSAVMIEVATTSIKVLASDLFNQMVLKSDEEGSDG